MAVTTKKTSLFLVGGVAAAAIVAYAAGALDPLFKRTPETIAALPESGQADEKDARLPAVEPPAAASPTQAQPTEPEAAAPAAPEAAAPAAPEAEAPATAAPASEPPVVVPPSFDVVRVEANGSIVIAGRAAPSAKVDLLVGSNVIGSATAGAEGDFAVILEDPLKPGDYQIVLRATAPDNVVAMSVETAVVSVPETQDGQVLALVEEPGKPSQMITLPEPQRPAEAAKPPEATAPPAAEAPPPVTEAPAASEPEPEGEMQAALPPETAPAQAPATPPPAGPAVRVEAVEIDGRKIFVAGAADPGRTVRGYANEILLGDAKASPDGRFLIEADRDLPVGDYIIRVDALEPDGVKVAARAAVPFEREPGETIAAVAPPAPATMPSATTPPAAETPPAGAAPPAAEAPATAPSATQPPPADTAAAPPTEAPAAVEAPEAAQPPATAEAPSEQQPASDAQAPATAAPASEAPAAVAEAPAGQAQPAEANPPVAQAPAAPDASGQAPQSAAEPTAEAGTPSPAEAPAAMAETPAAGSETQGSQTEAEALAAEEPAAPAGTADAPAAEAPQPEAPAASEATPPSGEAGTDVATAPAGEEALPSPPSAGVDEVLAPKLQSVDSAVIIRRGDTLWRISRRVYGRGIRYSTIYLANESQIEDPDRIWPGQVFKVPEKSDDGAAEADYSTLGDRLTTVPAEGEGAAPDEAQQ